ncbi:MAG TPA: DUF1365 domain-containing protein [Candidatus Saccharimonadia bacterium]|nr:DUF1365 domain-containing protein [Candidatus Saccharimonadia bacterium]
MPPPPHAHAAAPAELRAEAAPLESAIYEGWVRHRRHAPHPHAFRYRTCLLYLDLAELDRVFRGRLLWSVGRRNVAEFRRSDYLGDARVPLDEAVRACVAEATGRRPAGPIRLLTHLRYFGHCFNPVSFYYCFEPDGAALDGIVAEITNTPWKERHAYVLPVAQAESHGIAREWRFDKRFHVSPFMPMEREYRWRFTTPGEALRVHMDVLNQGVSDFDATLVLERRPLDARGLASTLVRYPLMTVSVVAAIHWQAFLIWRRHNPVYAHPKHDDGDGA